MRFLLIFNKKMTPEWAQCYYDYKTVKRIIGLCRKATSIQANIMDVTGQNQNHLIEQKQNQLGRVNTNRLKEIYDTANQNILKIVDQANHYFFAYHVFNKKIVFLFLQIKMHELYVRNKRYTYWNKFVDKQDNQCYVSLLGYCYNESKLLDMMAEMNYQAYKKIIKKHKKIFGFFDKPTPDNQTIRMNRTLKDIKQQTSLLRQNYAQHKQLYPKEARIILGQQVEQNKLQSSVYFYIFGLVNGFNAAILVTSIIMIGIYLAEDPHFLVEFRVWKFIGFIILYLWVFGITFFVYEEYRLNYHLIFELQSSKNQSISMLSVASILTLFYLCLFIFYVLNLSGVYILDFPVIIAFPAALLGIFIVGIVARFTVFSSVPAKFFIKTACSIFGTFSSCFSVTFGMVWATEQLISLAQLFADLAFSICFYAQMNDEPQTCSSTFKVAQGFALFIISTRLIQSIRQIKSSNSKDETTKQIYILIRSVFSLILCALSFGYYYETSGAILYPWIALAILTIMFVIWADLISEWGLLLFEPLKQEEQNQTSWLWRCIGYKPILREKRTFSKYLYRFFIIMSLFLRIAWLFTINPSIIYINAPKPELILTVCAFLELLRRGIWNVMIVDKQHINNCEQYRVRMDYDQKEQVIKNQISRITENKKNQAPQKPSFTSEQRIKQQQLNLLRGKQEIKNLKENLYIKNSQQKQIMQWIDDHEGELEKIQKQVNQQVNKRN